MILLFRVSAAVGVAQFFNGAQTLMSRKAGKINIEVGLQWNLLVQYQADLVIEGSGSNAAGRVRTG